MSYRDDLEAALARIEALEVELASRDHDVTAAVGGREAAWQTERARFLDELTTARMAHAEQLAAATELRSERDRLLSRVKVLQAERSANAPKIVPQPAGGKWPVLWDHNRRFAAVEAGKPANVLCPQCHAAGRDVQMVREIGVGVMTGSKNDATFELSNVACPHCMFYAFLRLR